MYNTNMKQYTLNCSVDSANTDFPENSYTLYDLEEVLETIDNVLGRKESGIKRVEITVKDLK